MQLRKSPAYRERMLSCMTDQAEANSGETVTSPNPLAVTRRIARTASWYAIGLVVVLAVLGIVFRHSLSWGDVPTWVMAITTLLAFLAAAFAGLVAYDLFKVETARDLKAAEERRLAAQDRRIAEAERAAKREADERAQAILISGWTDSVRANDEQRQLHVANMSDEPVYNLNIFLEDEDHQDQNHEIIQTPIQSNTINKRFLIVIPPRFRISWGIPRKTPASAGPNSAPRVGLLFDDKNGVRWYRDWDGKITRAPTDNPESHRPTKRGDIERSERQPIK